MSWAKPNKGRLDNPTDLILFNEGLDAAIVTMAAADRVVSGCAVSPQTLLTLDVAKGAILSGGTLLPVAAGVAVIGTPHLTEPRLDMVVATSGGAIAVRAGTAASTPVAPTRTGGDVPLALVYVTPLDTAIAAPAITDLRLIVGRGPCTIYSSGAAVTFNNTLLEQTLFSLTLPSGLLAANKAVRLQCGGTFLCNSGTPTIRFQVKYGGTAMFNDISGTATADVDRVAWAADLMLVGRSFTSQILNGTIWLTTLAAKTAPTAGIGDFVATQLLGPVWGSGSINSDTGDRALAVTATLSVANAADEMVLDYATAELL